MRIGGGGGYGGTIVVDVAAVRRASGLLAEDAQALGELASRVRGHPLPEMPADVAGRVTGSLAEVGSGLAGLPSPLVEQAQELRVRALWAQIADQLSAGDDLEGANLTEFKAAYASGLLTRYAEPWEVQLARDYAQKLHHEEHPGGLSGLWHSAVHDVGGLFSGAWDAIKDPAVMLYHLTPLSGGDWTKQWADLGRGLAYGVTHPVEFGKTVLNLDALQRRGFAYWLGNLAPAAAATLLSGGAVAAVRGGEGAAALARSGEAADALETSVAEAEATAARRAAELQAQVPAASRGRVTMGAGVVEDASGKRLTVVATSEARGYLRRGVTLEPGEVVVSGTGHAEEDIVAWAKAHGYRVVTVGAGRPICTARCAKAIADAGATAATPLKAAPPFESGP